MLHLQNSFCLPILPSCSFSFWFRLIVASSAFPTGEQNWTRCTNYKRLKLCAFVVSILMSKLDTHVQFFTIAKHVKLCSAQGSGCHSGTISLHGPRTCRSGPPKILGFAVTSKSNNYFTSSDPHRDIILKHIRHKFWNSFCPSVSRFHQNYPLLLVPSPGSGSSNDHCDLSSQTDSNWLSLCLIQNRFRSLGVSRRLDA